MSVLSAPCTGEANRTFRLRQVLDGLRSVSPTEAVLGLAGIVVLLCYAVVAIAHWNDRFQINFVSGVCITLAQRLNDGVFYPNLFDGEHYAGTRYMPLSFVVHAGLARLTGEYLVSGKLIAYDLSLILFVEMFIILRGLGCGRGSSVALISLVLLTPAGFLACTTIRGDLLAVVLQLGALIIVGKSGSKRGVVCAGIVCALAMLCKVTAVWAGLAIACSFLPSGRRRTGVVFAASWLISLSVALLLSNALSAGRMAENFAVFSLPGADNHRLFQAPFFFLAKVANGGLALGLLVPVALIGSAFAIRQRRLTTYHFALFFCVPALVVLCADPGVDYNHLLDLVVFSVLVAGHFWSALPAEERGLSGPRVSFAVALGWVLLAGTFSSLEPRLREVGYSPRGDRTRYTAIPLADQIAAGDRLLTEHPWIEVSRGQTPVVLDPFCVARMARARPELTAPLEKKIRDGSFDKIVLLNRLDDDAENHWKVNFGPSIVRAMETRYRLAGKFEEFFVYVPKQ